MRDMLVQTIVGVGDLLLREIHAWQVRMREDPAWQKYVSQSLKISGFAILWRYDQADAHGNGACLMVRSLLSALMAASAPPNRIPYGMLVTTTDP